jgi:hypothetical protein
MQDKRTENTTLAVDKATGLAYVWLVWALKDGRCDLVAIATTREARNRYSDGWIAANPTARVRVEKAFVDHLYGGEMLTLLNTAAIRRQHPHAG